jgi:hypothetical protein
MAQLRGILSTIFSSAPGDAMAETIAQQDEMKCLTSANQSPTVTDIDNKTADLAKNWQPTGYFTLDEVNAIVSTIKQADATALAQVIVAPKSTGDADQVIKQAADYLARNDSRAQPYVDAATKAQQQGLRAIYAPGLKTWVLDSMVNISQAYVTVAALTCQLTWLDAAADAITTIWGAAKQIGSLVLSAGEGVVSATEGLITFLPYLKWVVVAAVLGLGGLFAYRQYQRLDLHRHVQHHLAPFLPERREPEYEEA